VIKSPCRHSVLDLSLPRTRYGGIQCFQAVIDSAPIFIGVTRRNDVRGCFSKVSVLLFQIDECLEKVLGATDCSLTTCFASCHLPERRRNGHSDRLEDFAAGAEAFATDSERFALVFNRNLL